MKRRVKKSEIKLNIADVVLTVQGGNKYLYFRDDDPHKHFVVLNGRPDLMLEICLEPIPDEFGDSFGQKLFESGGVWSLHRNNRSYLISLSSPALGDRPYKMAVMNGEFTRGVIYCGKLDEEKRNLSYILEYPLGEVIFVNLLSRGRGVEVHACGLVDEKGQGLLFLGRSGAGKSTFARLWKDQDNITVLSDDRIIIRKKNDQFYIFGTPWHGDAGVCSTDSAPLKEVYFLAKSPKNEIRPLNRVVAASSLFQCCFPTFYNRAGLDFITHFIGEITQRVPCQVLGFLPEDSAVEFIRSLEKRSPSQLRETDQQ